ncbi:MAG: TlpA disulfide reductase family protein, partial [Acidobacteriota bacterium]
MRYISLLLCLSIFTGCKATPTVDEIPCERSPGVEQVYRRELALFDSCGSSPACLDRRLKNVRDSLSVAPDDVALHLIYQFVQKNHGPAAEGLLVEEYRRRATARGDAEDLYLYARLLSQDNPQRVALLEESVRLNPSLPRPHRSLLDLYSKAGEIDSAKQSLQAYLSLCPTKFGIYRQFADLLTSEDSWRPHLEAAGSALRSPPLEESYHLLPDLWSTELDLAPQNYRTIHSTIRQDLEAIATLDMGQRTHEEITSWWRVQHQGFSLLGDASGTRRALEERAKLEPCHEDVVNGRIAAWGEDNPLEGAPTPENVAAMFRREGKASEAWLESCPSSWRYWGAYLSGAAADPEVADREVLRRVHEARRAGESFAAALDSTDRSTLATVLARTLHDRGLKVEVGSDWLGAEWEKLGATADGALQLAALFPPEVEDTAAASRVGMSLPAFELADLDGRLRSTDELRGKIVYVDIWSSSCIPCRNAMPKVQALYELTKDDDRFEVLTLSIDASPKHAIALIRGNDYSFPVIVNSDYTQALDVKSLPTQWLLGGDLEIVQDLATAMIPYDQAWPEKVLALMEA